MRSLCSKSVVSLGRKGYKCYMRDKLKYWSKKLGIDAYIHLNLDSPHDKVGGQGSIDYELTGGTAVIRIVDRSWYSDQGYVKPQDPEVTLVHELLHYKHGLLECTTIKKGSLEYEIHHRNIADIARLLVKLNRSVSEDE